MEESIIAQGAGAEPVLAAPAGTPSGVDSPDVQHSGSEATPASSTSAGLGVLPEAGEALIREVRQLWAARGEALASARRSKEEALGILLELGKLLSEAKQSLARPGRKGGWSSFVRALGFSRAEADGLVRRYRRTLEPQAACTGETEAAVAALAGGPAETDAGACLGAAEVVAVVSTLATEPAPQPSAETPAVADGMAATPTESGQAAAVDNTGDGNVQLPKGEGESANGG
jgi:hypothetical protein